MSFRKIIFSAVIVFFTAGAANAQFTGKPRYQIKTTRAGSFLGNILVELYPTVAPNHVKNFDSLVNKSFYDTTAFHRVIPGFMIQGGDPNSRHGPKSTWGYGDPTQPTVNAEFSILSHKRGILSAARDVNINSANSQFFICVVNVPSLDGQYSIYGHVVTGMDIVDTIVNEPRDTNDCPFQKIEMFVTYVGSNDTIPNAPTLNLPVSGTQNIGGYILAKWFAVSDAVMYHIDVSTDSLFSTLFRSKDVTATNYNITGLQGSTTYYWRVKTNNGGNWSVYSDTWKFSTTMNASVNNLAFIEKGYKLEQNVPNPSNGITTINFTMPGKEKVKISFYDAEGRLIKELINEEVSKGEHQVSFNTTSYAAGTYFYRMDAGSVSSTKILVVK